MSNTCKICYEEKDLKELPCDCDNSCNECLSRYLINQIKDGAHEIICPGCDEYIPYQTISNILSNESKYEYIADLDRNIVHQATNMKYIRCPECNNKIKIDDDDINEDVDEITWIKCDECYHDFCYHCLIVRDDHDYHECEITKNDLADALGVSNNSLQRCPKCSSAIYKAEGCDSMRCPECGIRFCWDCSEIVSRRDIREGKHKCCEFDGYDSDVSRSSDKSSDSD